jgi:protein O-mannosyl-transferase
LRHRLIVFIAALVAFGGGLAASFHFDDYAILSDPVLTSPSGWIEVWRPLQTRPLTWFTFWANYQLGGRQPLGYHALNLALHLAAALLLLDLLGRWMPPRAALVGAMLFAIHPIQAEAVVYVFARGTLLATLLCLLSLRAWTAGRRWPAVAWFAAALLAKEECVAFPLLLLFWHLVDRRDRAERPPLVVMTLLSLAAGARVFAALAATPGAWAGAAAGISPFGYLSAQGVSILRYARLLVLPWGFTVDPEIHSTGAWAAWLALLVAIAFASWRARRSRPAFWAFGALILLAPSSSIFPALDLAADRRVYLPMVALAASAGLLLERWNTKVLAALSVLLVLLSAARTQTWRTEHSLWSEAVAAAPAKVRPRIQLARFSSPAEAEKLLLEAAALEPENPIVPAELGRLYLTEGRADRALGQFGRALALRPNHPQALSNRGLALLGLGQWAAARQDFERALAFDPCLFDARFNLRQMGVRVPAPPSCRYSDQQLQLLRDGR